MSVRSRAGGSIGIAGRSASRSAARSVRVKARHSLGEKRKPAMVIGDGSGGMALV